MNKKFEKFLSSNKNLNGIIKSELKDATLEFANSTNSICDENNIGVAEAVQLLELNMLAKSSSILKSKRETIEFMNNLCDITIAAEIIVSMYRNGINESSIQ